LKRVKTRSIVPFIAIKGNWIYQYSLNVDPPPRNKEKLSLLQLNKTENPYSSFGKSAQKLLMQTLSNWTVTQEYAGDQIGHHKATPLRNHTFVTLTLPYTQLHCDKVIKRECLNPFIINLQRNFKVNNYLWKAELQKNGNIHFHILFDKFIPWQRVRSIWNNSTHKLGYIDWFATENGHFEPNSTDIHSIRKTKNIRAYIAKYVSKKIDGRDICGHAWGRSDSLNLLKPIILHEDYQTWKWLEAEKERNEHQIFSNEYVGITKFKKLPHFGEFPYAVWQKVWETLKYNLHILNDVKV
jgi:hypothetical protein